MAPEEAPLELLKVIYCGEINLALDKKVTKAIEEIGYKWYAQGFNPETRERDISFLAPCDQLLACLYTEFSKKE